MFVRRLRGLRVQLLLWTILPLAVVLVIVSVAGITSHRRAMTRLVADRDRGVVLAEAAHLGRDIERRVTELAAAAAMLDPTDGAEGAFAVLAARLASSYAGGIAVFSAAGQPVETTAAATTWAGLDQTRDFVARAAGDRPQFESVFEVAGGPYTLVGVATPAGQMLIGALLPEALDLGEGLHAETGAHGAVFVLDSTGRRIHHHNPGNLAVDETALVALPAPPADGAGMTELRADRQALLVSYARVQPTGWTLVIAEDVHAVDSMGISVVEVLPLMLLFVALVSLLAVSFGFATIVRPLQELDRRAQRVTWGDFEAVQKPVGGVQEIDDLRDTFAQMAERIRAYQAGMRDYLSAVTQAQEAERARLAHELHDDTVQALIALKQRAQMAHKALGDPARAGQRLDELTGLIDQELTGLRRLIGDLRPIYLEDLGFVPALEMLAQQSETRHGVAVRLNVRGEAVRLAPDLEMAAFRIVQQALNNVAAHAHASRCDVGVEFAADGVTLSVTDDGRGFSPPDMPADLARDGHFGLMGMTERAMLYGGRLDIRSAPGQGTIITAWLPIH